MNLEPIDTSTTAGKAEVMRLAAEGRKVAGARKGPGNVWDHVVRPTWNWEVCNFAIIAEPVAPEEVWVIVTKRGAALSVWHSKDEAKIESEDHSFNLVRYVRSDQ